MSTYNQIFRLFPKNLHLSNRYYHTSSKCNIIHRLNITKSSTINSSCVQSYKKIFSPNQHLHKLYFVNTRDFSTQENDKQQRNSRIILIGLAVIAATVAALYQTDILSNKKDVKADLKQKKKKAKLMPKYPATSEDIPKKIPYLLIGGGTASFSAFRAIKSIDPLAKVLVISNEHYYPYMRPPLSKEMWFRNDKPQNISNLTFTQWNGTERSLFYEPEDFYVSCKELPESEKGGVAVARGWSIKKIDVANKKAILEDDSVIEYDKCLIATGAVPRSLDIFKHAHEKIKEKVKVYRSIYDFEDLDNSLTDSKAVAIIGGGFLGSELACALSKKVKQRNVKVYQIFRENGNMAKVLPEYLSLWTLKKVQDENVEVLTNTEVQGVSLDKDRLKFKLSNGNELTVDQVVVAIGVEPNTELAETSGLEVDPELGGFLVNTELQARSNLYIAGDCACFYDTKLGRRRVEHHDHAVVSGRLAGENMTGSNKPYLHQSMFWSDLGPDVGYEAIGVINSSLPTVGVFAKGVPKPTLDNSNTKLSQESDIKAITFDASQKTVEVTETVKTTVTQDSVQNTKNDLKSELIETPKFEKKTEDEYNKGVIFYLRNDVVVGIVLWNVFNRMSIARQVINEGKKYDDLNEVAKLFNIHED